MQKLEKIFLIFTLLFGMFFVFVTPPFQSVDEQAHFLRAYAISNGQFIAEKQQGSAGSVLPHAVNEFITKYTYLIKNINAKTSFSSIKDSEKLRIDRNDTEFVPYPNTALYSPVSYIAQAFGILCANPFSASPLILLYFGRIFNLLLYCALGFLAIRTMPVYKEAAFLVLLMPMNLSLAASVSSDSSLIAVSVLFFAKFVEIYTHKQDIDIKNTLYLLAMCLFFALTKQYVFMDLFILLLPISAKKKLGILTLSFAAAALWSAVVSKLYVSLSPAANPILQLKFILTNPLKYLGILLVTAIVKAFRLIVTAVGVLGWQDTRLDIITYITYPVILVLSVLKPEKILKAVDSYKTLFITALSYCVIVTLVYLSWDKPGATIVTGLNGKYFTPLILPFLIALASLVTYEFRLKPYQIYCYSFVVLISAVVSVLIRFYNVFPNLYYQI